MNDRELLELAAKAAGWTYFYTNKDMGGDIIGHYVQNEQRQRFQWNPLDNDGETLRLAVKLKMLEEGSGQFNKLLWNLATCVGPDEYKNTRLAIVRTAAEIGRSMP